MEDSQKFNVQVSNLIFVAKLKDKIKLVEKFKKYVHDNGWQIGSEVIRALQLYMSFSDKKSTDKSDEKPQQPAPSSDIE